MSRPTVLQASPLSTQQVAAGITLPESDVRRALDAAVRRRWAENTRGRIRIGLLLAGDTAAGLLALPWRTWFVDGFRPMPDAERRP